MNRTKRNIIALGALGAVACVGIISAIPLAMNTLNLSKADETENAIYFSSSKNKILNTYAAYTEQNNKYGFYYNSIANETDCWQKINNGGYFCTYFNNTSYYYNNAIHDMKTIYFNFKEADLPFTLTFTSDGVFNAGTGVYTGTSWSRTYTTKTGGQTIDFEGHPRYFMFKNTGSSAIDVIDMKIEYGCDAGADTTWDNTHGVNPVVDTTTNTVTYGLYPQTHINDAELITALTAKATALGVSDEEFFWYNDEYYVKDTGNPYGTDYTFLDGTSVTKTASYFFKCEPIKWNIKGTDTNYTIDCSNILNASAFGESKEYANSGLRTLLNSDFYNKAFFLNNSNIVPTDLTDVGVEGDKIWVGSKIQYGTDWYSSLEARIKKPSDFALCNFAEMSTDVNYLRNGHYWTRTPNTSETATEEWTVNHAGQTRYRGIALSGIGVSPVLTIKI